MLWPIKKEDTPILHVEDFRTEDGKGTFAYHQYQLREQVKKLVNKEEFAKNEFYLTTGRTIVQYNNAAQTQRSEALNSKYDKDVVLASVEDSLGNTATCTFTVTISLMAASGCTTGLSNGFNR